MVNIVPIAKEEAMEIRAKCKGVHIAIVNRQSNHKKYYLTEERRALSFLSNLRRQKERKPRGKVSKTARRDS